MYILRLFEDDNASVPIDARLLREGTIIIGRDPGVDWVMHDPDCRISRRHCVITASNGAVTVVCLGANGVFDDANGNRYPDAIESAINVPTTLAFGSFRLVVDHAAQASAEDAGREAQTLILTPPLGASAQVPSDYADAAQAISYGTSLLDCFCEGAGLEPSAFALEDPEDIMRRAGSVYRQMVLGVGDLMAEREATRRRYQIARTTISGAGNNPFKWAPTQRLALDLLLAEKHGFMTGSAALAVSFKDIKRHLIATFRGLQESLRVAVASFDPQTIEREMPPRGSLLQSRSAQLWGEVDRRHADLAAQLSEGADGRLNQVFVEAYDAASNDLERAA